MPLKLSIWLPTGSQKSHDLEFNAGEVLVGRSSACAVHLPFTFVSEIHFTIVAEGDSFLISDNGSTNGTGVNDSRLAPFAYTELNHGDVITVGEIRIDVSRIDELSRSFSLEESSEEVRSMVWEVLKSSGTSTRAIIEIVRGVSTGLRVALSEDAERVTIGTSESCDVTLDDPQCQAEHVELVRVGSAYEATPLNEALTRVDGSPLVEAKILGDDARLVIGDTEICFHDPLQRYLDAIEMIPSDPLSEEPEAVLSTQQIRVKPFKKTEAAPPSFGPPDRPPVPGQLNLESELITSGAHRRHAAPGWGSFEYLVVVVTGLIVFSGVVAILVLLNVITL